MVPAAEPSFWDFAREWLERREHEVEGRTVEHWEWALNSHLRDYFGRKLLSEITAATVDSYKSAKLREERPLSAGSINKSLKVLAQILDDAVEYRAHRHEPGRRPQTQTEGGEAAANLA